MSLVGLFSGIGGLEVAFAEAGFETSQLVEIDPAARKVLEARFPNADIRDDVVALDALPSGTSIVTAGFPCQNLSMAGDKTGLAGLKSGVIEHMFRLLEASRVETVVIENVYFMLSLDRGQAMTRLTSEFERLGFRWAYRVLDTMDFGLPQRRRRVYLVACRSSDPRAALFGARDEQTSRSALELETGKPIGFYWTEGRSGVGFTSDGVPAIKVGSSVGIASAPAVLFPDGSVRMPSLQACEKLQGFPDGWTRIEGGLPGRKAEWRLVGNAVSVPVARSVAEALRSQNATLDLESRLLPAGAPWPQAAWNVGSGLATPIVLTHPATSPRPSIAAFLDDDWTLLSDRALDGFIARAVAGGLRMPSGFLDRLRTADRKLTRAAALVA